MVEGRKAEDGKDMVIQVGLVGKTGGWCDSRPLGLPVCVQEGEVKGMVGLSEKDERVPENMEK